MPLPYVTVNPSDCHQVTAYEVLSESTGLAPSLITMTETTVDIYTTNQTLIIENDGVQELYIHAVTTSDEYKEEQSFEVRFYNSCNQTAVISTLDESHVLANSTHTI